MGVLGLGGGLLGSNIYGLAASSGEKTFRARNVGIIKGFYYSGLFIGPPIAQVISNHYHAAGVFFALSILAALLCLFSVAQIVWQSNSTGVVLSQR